MLGGVASSRGPPPCSRERFNVGWPSGSSETCDIFDPELDLFCHGLAVVYSNVSRAQLNIVLNACMCLRMQKA